MKSKLCVGILGLQMLLLPAMLAGKDAVGRQVRLGDVTTVEGVRDNLLLGYGLVVGLNGTGDKLTNNAFTEQSLIAFLERQGVNTRGTALKSKNVAAVTITARLHAFARSGSQIDVTVSAMGDAKDLTGGTLLATPLYGADGEVTDISLNTVKVQNWDKTIVTIPTHALTNTQMKNWRGMMDAGGRRVKRAIKLDMHTIGFCTETILNKMRQLPQTQRYLEQKPDTKELTNASLFRGYVEFYLRSYPDIHQEMMLFVRQLSPDAEGLPIEIYAFIRQTNVYEYENVQAEIFDHLLAVLPHFGLRVFQNATD